MFDLTARLPAGLDHQRGKLRRSPLLGLIFLGLLGLSAFAQKFSLSGKTEAEIIAKYGQPQTVMDLGSTKVLGYPNMLIEFEDGIVTKVSAPTASSSPAVKAAPPKVDSHETSVKTSAPVEIGDSFELKFTSLTGDAVDLDLWRGKVVVIDFWATWCGPCVASMPHLLAAYKRYHAEGLEVVGISLDKDKARLLDFVEKNQVPWPQYFDGKGWENEVAQKHGIQSIPALWLINKKGLLVSKDIRGTLDKSIKTALSE